MAETSEWSLRYRYTCTECGYVRYGDHLLSMTRCGGCKAVKFGLQKREWAMKLTPNQKEPTHNPRARHE